jgi:hypothetical protein
MTPVLAFDIETIPDCAGIRRLYDLPADLAEPRWPRWRSRSAGRHQQRLPAAAPAESDRDQLRDALRRGRAHLLDRRAGATEELIIQRFFEGINKYVPQIVSWNGRNFDLPVLVARGLIHGVAAAVLLGHRPGQQGLPLLELHQPLP